MGEPKVTFHPVKSLFCRMGEPKVPFHPVKGGFCRMGEPKVPFYPMKSGFCRMKHSPLLCIDGALNGNVIDDAFLEVMLRIEKEMHHLRAKED